MENHFVHYMLKHTHHMLCNTSIICSSTSTCRLCFACAMASSCWVVVHREARTFLEAWDTDGSHHVWLSHPSINEHLIVLDRDDLGWIRTIPVRVWLEKRQGSPKWIHPEVVRPVLDSLRVYTLAKDCQSSCHSHHQTLLPHLQAPVTHWSLRDHKLY